MTQTEWLAATDPEPMLKFLRKTISDRKLRLLAVACCRRIWHLLVDPLSRKKVEIAEQFADGLATADELRTANRQIGDISNYNKMGANEIHAKIAVYSITSYHTMGYAKQDLLTIPSGVVLATTDIPAERVAQSGILRDIFGNPFRPVTLDPSWLTTTVVAMASGMYANRDFSPMPILADALQDADCDNEDILNHCRGPGPHVKGCWVVDLLLGKK